MNVKRLWIFFLCILLTIVVTKPSFAYNTVINTVRVPAGTYTAVNYDTSTVLGYFDADTGANIIGFGNSYGRVVIDTHRGDRKSGTIELEFRNVNYSGAVLYEKTISFANVTSTNISFDLPASVSLPYPVGRICVVMIQKITDADDGRGMNINFSNGGGFDAWQVVNTDQVAAVTLETVEEALDVASTAATNAANAKTSADAAKTSADTAATRSQTAINQTWYPGTYGGSSESVGNIAGYIRNQQLPGIDTKINNLQTSITNLQNSDTMPPVVDVQTVSGARATSGSSIQAIVTVTDNRPGPYTYSVNGGSYSALPADGRVTLPVTIAGTNTITVYVKDVAGNIGAKAIVIRKM